MPQYDDFGRPIYETAEEYNRAHREEKATRTYTSADGDTYSSSAKKNKKRQSVKKPTFLIFGAAVFFIIPVVAILFTLFNFVEESFPESFIVHEEEWSEVEIVGDDDYGEYLGDAETPLPEGFETFSYNGKSYTLPTTLEEILEMGFTLEEAYEEDYMLPTQYEETLILNDNDGYMYAVVTVSNYGEEEIPVEKAIVDYFYIDNPASYDAEMEIQDFVFGDGLTFESSYEEVEAYFGIPFYHYADHSEEGSYYDNYEWAYYGEDETHFVTITFWNGVISDIGIEKRIIEQ